MNKLIIMAAGVSITMAAQEMLSSKTVQDIEVPIDVKKKYRYLGTNSMFVAQGTGLCSLKSSSDNRVSDSGYNDGSLRVDVDP
jgi:hypothetical protein